MVESISWAYSGIRELEALGSRIVAKPGTSPRMTGSGFASNELKAVVMTVSPLRLLRGTWPSDDTSFLRFTFLMDGLIRLVAPDRTVLLRPGSISYQQSTVTFTTEATTPVTMLQVSLRIDEMRRYGFDTAIAINSLDPDARSTRAAYAFATAFALAAESGSDLPDESEIAAFSHVVKQLLTSAFLSAASAQPGTTSVRAATLCRARTVIDRTHRTPRCTPESVADAVNVSTRSLQRLFEDAGTTVASEIERSRVASAVELLRRRPREIPLETIASASGFSSADHLRRALKRREGLTPSDIRGRIGSSGTLPVQEGVLRFQRSLADAGRA
ncbi:helix-turn-helix domain-containing protein [Rathayibacter toxicus]|uniref:helix-turn-helix domain-containing protein n=2 Tax=Rathayibacter toxicus TaxID=145458 RepID=UPI001C03B5A0|nr:helix-turn-helix domain-containing protein [Rathayibacter toxicus]QWL31412.1 helix-turn-helix domain-containing protein [Rathayibacter toxicus]QWL33502.1 helix-turn-helix domain-containing protein [Rathayibacter toxicus]QWL35637.1 helix-turn-helix domain-containing protein [Rathayibacter toxicus]QWL37726.1 helix-turn-helix domain-containing protein [Rathayibacter toxicus]QWL39816.1 helix-turn-helix domain-containing protein [Rathayibacter toxicus]